MTPAQRNGLIVIVVGAIIAALKLFGVDIPVV